MKNLVILVGNLGADPEIKTFESGNKVANLKLATSEKWTNKAGEKVEETQWHSLVFFGKIVDVIEKYVKKGDRISVDGKIKYESYEKDGEKRYSTKIVCHDLLMLGGGNKSAVNESELVESDSESERLPF